MKIESTADLEALVKLCRKTGVSAIEVDGIKLTLDSGTKRKRKIKEDSADPQVENAPTEDEVLFWSSN